MEANGYALCMNSSLNPICLADVLAAECEHWYKVASAAQYNLFNRLGDSRALVHDLYIRLRAKADLVESDVFVKTLDDAHNILGSTIQKYAASSVYMTGLEDLDKASAATTGSVTFCGLDTFGDSLDFEEATAVEATDVQTSLDVHFAKDIANRWDSMNDASEYTIEQKLKIVSELAVAFAAVTTDVERTSIIETARAILDIGPDTPQILKDTMLTLVKY